MSEQPLKGGEFLIRKTEANTIFIPEEWDEEQKMIAQTCKDFIEQEVYPNLEDIDNMKEGLMPSLLEKAGALGMMGISIPEEYGGFGKDFVTSMLTTEITGSGYSFAVALSASTGIGTLPILYYGTEDQRQKYIPKLASGEWKGCYCLTEPGSGSDANSGKTKAILSDDGKSYFINGQKMWITNAGFADVFTVFAKIDDDKNLSAFILEKGMEGISLNAEEKKMGIKGSSTRQVFFNNVKIPVENLLGEREQGFKIALNILNIGRIKLAGAALGGAKRAIKYSIQYANEREQFGTSIANFGAIKHKIGSQGVLVYAVNSAIYRCSQNIEDAINGLIKGGMDKQAATLKGVEEFAAEAAILKIAGSEVIDFVVDEAVQIYGGMGFSAESPVERAYRDSRINRIFEGTNEINRMLIVDMLLKKAMKGELNLLGAAQKVMGELMEIPDLSMFQEDDFVRGSKYVENFKKAVLLTAGAAAQKFGKNLQSEQEILMNISDMIIQTYVAESVLLRVQKLASLKKGDADVQKDIMKVYIYDAADTIYKAGKDALFSFNDEDDLRMAMVGLKRFTKVSPFNVKEARRRVADKMISSGDYCF